MNPESTALVVVDDNNDFLSENGKLHGAVKDFLERRGVIAILNDLLGKSRDKGVKVVHTPLSFSSDYKELRDEPYGILKVVKHAGAFKRGSWGAQTAEVLETKGEDIVLEGKCTLDAFESTALKSFLEERGIETVALAGPLSNLCIESTMRSAYDLGYEVIALTDATVAMTEEQHSNAVENNWPMFSRPMSSAEFIDALSNQTNA